MLNVFALLHNLLSLLGFLRNFFNNYMLGLGQCGNQFSLVTMRKFFHNRIYSDCKGEYNTIKG